jgi:menaquinone-dependent protoporphyrinogen oxidase
VGRHQPSVARFVRDRVAGLNDLPSAFFSVCLTRAAGTDETCATARDLLEECLAETRWEPDVTAPFAGALRYSEYGLVTRFLLRRIAWKYGEDTDTSRDDEYTDWAAVERFAADVAALVD